MLNYLTTVHAQFGTDVVNTYGPLGYLHSGGFVNAAFYSKDTWLRFLLFQVVQKAFFVSLICWIGLRLPLRERLVFLAWSALLSLLGTEAIPLLLITFSAALLMANPRPSHGITTLVIAFVAVESLIKHTFLFYSIAVVCFVALHALISGPRRLPALVAPVLFSVILLLLWLFAGGQRLSGLPAFFAQAFAVSDAHQSGVVLEPQLDVLLTAAVGFILTISYFAFLFWREWRIGNAAAVAPLLILSAGAFMSWKQGFVRADGIHNHVFYAFILISLAGASALFQTKTCRLDNGPMSHAIVTIVPVLLVVGVLSVNRPFSAIATDQWAKCRWVMAPRASLKAVDLAARQTAINFALPRTHSVVGNATVDVIGHEQAIALLNGLNFRPSPVFQGYLACSPGLARLNAEHYRSINAPEFVILKLQVIDQHFPTLDDAAVLIELLRSYEYVLEEGGYVLLHRTHSPRIAELVPIRSGWIRRGDMTLVPPGAIWCSFQIKDGLLGRLIRFLYHRSPEWIEVSAGTDHQYRLPIDMAETPFLLSPLIENNEQFVRFLADRNNQQPVTRMEIKRAGLGGFLPPAKIRYTFFGLADSPTTASVPGGKL
jgi:hypothetical protein